MDLGLRGKRALVTGSTSGIGEGIAKGLAREGVSVVVTGRNQENADRVVREISEYGHAVAVMGALDTDGGAAGVANGAVAALGGIDILVNNASGLGAGGWDNLTPDAWLDRMNSSLVSMVRMIRLLAPAMKERGWGRLIQMASTGGSFSGPDYADYSAAKAGVMSLSMAASRQYAPFGVTSNAIGCGTFRSPPIEEGMIKVAAERIKASPEEAERWLATEGFLPGFSHPGSMGNHLHRFGRMEMANVICFLASERSTFVTGAVIRVDGGQAPVYNP